MAKFIADGVYADKEHQYECERLADAIRALSPQPRPDAQAQREALAEFCYGKGYNDAQWHKDGKTAAELVEAFDRSQS